MKSKILTALLIAGITTTVAYNAFSADEKKVEASNNSPAPASNFSGIAVVDAQQVMEKSLAVSKIQEQIEKKYESYGKESSKKEEYFKKKFEELEKQKSVLSKEAFEKKDGDVHKELAEVQKKFQNDQAELEKAAFDAHQQVQNTLIDIVKEESAKSGFKLVLQKAQTIYSDDTLDITQKVLETLNKKLPDVTVKF